MSDTTMAYPDSQHPFVPFPKLARLSRHMVVTEKIDGTNAQITITDDGRIYAGSRNRWLTPEADNYGFAAWVARNQRDLFLLGEGRHYGEWWGTGIQRGYGLSDRRFSLFNVGRWNSENLPACCSVVPTLYMGPFDTTKIEEIVTELRMVGSHAAPGYLAPEGVVIRHHPSDYLFKKTCDKDESPKSLVH